MTVPPIIFPWGAMFLPPFRKPPKEGMPVIRYEPTPPPRRWNWLHLIALVTLAAAGVILAAHWVFWAFGP